MSVEMLIITLRQNVVVDMDGQACSEAPDGLKAYYKVETFSSILITTLIDHLQ
jgi:hypothetical protein